MSCTSALSAFWRIRKPDLLDPQEMLVKRIFDLVFATTAIVLLSPLFLVAGIIVSVIDGLPIFNVSERVGRNRRPFGLIKFRTMRSTPGNAQNRITLGASDARITALGRHLRRWKIDELPQLFNVVLGDMSIVGPRPEDPRYVESYDDSEMEVFCVRPGLTDITVTQGHFHDAALLDRIPESKREEFYRKILMRRKLRLNIAYIRTWSLSVDFGIVIKTALILLGIIPNKVPEELYADRPYPESTGRDDQGLQ